MRHGLGGWQVTGILSAQTGLPITVTQSSSTPVQRGEYIGGQVVFSDYRNTLQYLNPAAFQRIPVSSASGAPVRAGNAGPGEWRAPGLWNLNLSLAKNFSLREKVSHSRITASGFMIRISTAAITRRFIRSITQTRH
jgi:hypothetical protein